MRPLLPLLALLVACEPPPPPVPGAMEVTGDVISVVNGKEVRQGMVDAMLNQMPAQTKDQIIARNQMDQVKDMIVTGEVLYQEALNKKYQDRPEIKQAIALAERQALVNALIDDAVKAGTTDTAVKAWYDEHAVQFKRAQIKVHMITVKDEAVAKGIFDEIKGGKDFAEVAKAKSEDPASARTGGDVGWLDGQRLAKEFGDSVTTAKKGDLVGPLKGSRGFTVLLIDDTRDAIPVEEVSDKIKQQMTERHIIFEQVNELITRIRLGTGG